MVISSSAGKSILSFALCALIVMCHFQTGPLEAALDVEALVGFAAIEDGLVAARLLSNKVQRLDHAETQLLALLILGDGDVLDMSD